MKNFIKNFFIYIYRFFNKHMIKIKNINYKKIFFIFYLFYLLVVTPILLGVVMLNNDSITVITSETSAIFIDCKKFSYPSFFTLSTVAIVAFIIALNNKLLRAIIVIITIITITYYYNLFIELSVIVINILRLIIYHVDDGAKAAILMEQSRLLSVPVTSHDLDTYLALVASIFDPVLLQEKAINFLTELSQWIDSNIDASKSRQRVLTEEEKFWVFFAVTHIAFYLIWWAIRALASGDSGPPEAPSTGD